jgi:hypothetical protein
MPSYPISQPADNAAAYTYTQPVRDAIASVNGFVATPINAQTGTTYTFVLTDITALVRAGNAGAQTYTIPPVSSVQFLVGCSLTVIRYGTGTLTMAEGTGVTIRTPASLTARAQYSPIVAFHIASNEWILGGDLT